MAPMPMPMTGGGGILECIFNPPKSIPFHYLSYYTTWERLLAFIIQTF
jgi:hypothetical protein